MRTTNDVLKSHLKLRKEGKTEEDIQQNFASDVVIITKKQKYHGHDGVRTSAEILQKLLGNDASFIYDKVEAAGEMGYLVWSAESKEKSVRHGVDSFHIKDGLIWVQTIFYTAKEKE